MRATVTPNPSQDRSNGCLAQPLVAIHSYTRKPMVLFLCSHLPLFKQHTPDTIARVRIRLHIDPQPTDDDSISRVGIDVDVSSSCDSVFIWLSAMYAVGTAKHTYMTCMLQWVCNVVNYSGFKWCEN